MRIKFYPLQQITEPYLDQLVSAAAKVLASGSYINGPCVTAFESDFARLTSSPFCVSTSSGLSSLQAALSYYSFKAPCSGIAVLPVNTFIATAYSAIRSGYRVLFVDIQNNNLQPSVQSYSSAIRSNHDIIIPVSLYGIPLDYHELTSFASSANLRVIEDAAQSYGASVHGNPIGTGISGWTTAYSFYPGKTLGAFGDGGCLTTSDHDIFDFVLKYRNYGSSQKYYHEIIGSNERLDEIQASLLQVRLAVFNTEYHQKRQIADIYLSRLSSTQITLPLSGITPGTQPSLHLFPIVLPSSMSRSSIMKYLQESGIETLIHYPQLLNRQKALSNSDYVINADDCFPVAEQISQSILSLPLHSSMSTEDAHFVCDIIEKYIETYTSERHE